MGSSRKMARNVGIGVIRLHIFGVNYVEIIVGNSVNVLKETDISFHIAASGVGFLTILSQGRL